MVLQMQFELLPAVHVQDQKNSSSHGGEGKKVVCIRDTQATSRRPSDYFPEPQIRLSCKLLNCSRVSRRKNVKALSKIPKCKALLTVSLGG